MLLHKCHFLLQLFLKMNAYFSLFRCKKSCPSYEFLVVFGQVLVWDRKSARRARFGMACGGGRAGTVRMRGGSGEDFSASSLQHWNSCSYRTLTRTGWSSSYPYKKFLNPHPTLPATARCVCWLDIFFCGI